MFCSIIGRKHSVAFCESKEASFGCELQPNDSKGQNKERSSNSPGISDEFFEWSWAVWCILFGRKVLSCLCHNQLLVTALGNDKKGNIFRKWNKKNRGQYGVLVSGQLSPFLWYNVPALNLLVYLVKVKNLQTQFLYNWDHPPPLPPPPLTSDWKYS